MTTRTITATNRIRSCRVRLLSRMPFFGLLSMHMDMRVEEDPEKSPTASVTSGGVIRFGLDFMETLTDAELAGVMCHEILHVVLFYWQRQGNRKTQLVAQTEKGLRTISAWNVAHDYAVNLVIKDLAAGDSAKSWIALPPNCLIDEKYRGWPAEQIYDDVLSNKDEIDLSGFEGDVFSDGSEGDTLRWKHAILQASSAHRARGMSLSDAIQAVISKICHPEVSWLERLAQWVGDTLGRPDYSYRRPSRRSESAREILCSPYPQGLPNIIVLWDTSGSMMGEEDRLLSQVLGILEATPASIRVVTCDTVVRGDSSSVKDASDVVPLVAGGGGSDLSPAFERIVPDMTPDTVLICLTDGLITVPQHPPPAQAVLWVLTPGGVDPTGGRWGQVIQMNR